MQKMTIAAMKRYMISKSSPSSIRDIAQQFACPEHEISAIVEYWVKKGNIVACNNLACTNCPIACKKLKLKSFYWNQSH